MYDMHIQNYCMLQLLQPTTTTYTVKPHKISPTDISVWLRIVLVHTYYVMQCIHSHFYTAYKYKVGIIWKKCFTFSPCEIVN